MKKFKNSFGVKGSPSLLQALKEEAEKLGWKYDKDFNSGYSEDNPDLYFNANKPKDAMKPQHFSFSNVGNCIIYNLPEQWDECLKAASELEEVEPWAIGTYVVFLKEYGGNPKGTISSIVRTREYTIETKANLFQTGETCCLLKDKECKWFPTLQEAEAFSKKLSKEEEFMEITGYSVKFEDDKVSIGCYKDITLKQLKTLRKAIKIVNDLGNDLTITEDGIIEHRDDNQISLEEIEELIKRLNG